MWSLWTRLANPRFVLRLVAAIVPWSARVTCLLFALGAWMALVASPADYQQGEAVRIMYVHVPAAYLGLFGYALLAVASGFHLVWRNPVADLAAVAAAPVGAVMTAVALVTGALWGRPMWGAWWVWDARLTSVLILFFLYLGYLALRGAIEDRDKARRAAAILAVVGALDLPIIHFSVEWWNTLHQPASLLRSGGAAIAPSMLWPLLVMLAAFQFFFVTVWLWRLGARLAPVVARRARKGEVA